MNWEEFLASLAKMPDGEKLVAAIKAIVEGKDSEIILKSNQHRALSKTLKTAEEQFKKATERLEKFYDHTGLGDDIEDLDAALAELKAKEDEMLKNGGKASPEIAQLQKDIAKLQRDLKKAVDAQAAAEKKALDETTKRQSSERNRVLLAALTEHKAIKPDQLLKILSDRVKVNDDDTVVFVKEDGEEIQVKDGVKSWLDANPEFVLNSQNSGANSFGGVNKKESVGSFGKELAKQSTDHQAPAIQKAEAIYFGKGV